MHELALRQRRELGDRAAWHVGDVTWGLRQHEGREDEWTIRVWRDDDGAVAAWSWLKGDKGWVAFDLRGGRGGAGGACGVGRADGGGAAGGWWRKGERGWLEFDLRRARLALPPETLDEP